jgi:HD-GYP domain-containing protein (c-di-GMP phosphodiesterase class II)
MTYQHSVAVADSMSKLAHKMGLDEEQCLEAELLGAVHELAKLQTSPDIFKKLQAGQTLNEPERQKLKHDPKVLLSILGTSWLSPSLIQAIENLETRFDGKGKNANSGEAIPQLTRMLAICDIHDLLCRRRSGKAISPEQALKALDNNQNTLLDPVIVCIFRELILTST